MTAHLPALIVISPLAIALLLPVLVRLSAELVRVVAITSALISFTSSIGALKYALAKGNWHYFFGGWPAPWGIEYVIDPLAGGMAVLVSFFSLLVIIYAGPYLVNKPAREKGYFYTLYLLLTAGLLGIVVTGDVFNLYVFLEISSLAAYALIASGGHRATVAAFRYLLIGTAAASFYLLGIGYLYAITGSLNMADLSELLPPLMDSRAVVIAVALIVIGLGIKMALFPLHGWLPDAYSYAPAPVIGFIAAVMAKVSAYALYRVLYFVLKATGPVSLALDVMGWMAAAGILFGSIMAILQRDFWRMLAYSSVAQMCYIALGISLANTMGLFGALLHILNHAVTKGCLFLVAGSVNWQTGVREIHRFVKMSRRMPLTMGAFIIAALSMIGLPPTAGFFSKWYLVLGAIQSGAWAFVIVLALSSLLTAVYFFRIIEHAYFKEPLKGKDGQRHATEPAKEGWELYPTMLVPILILGIGILALGILSEQVITHLLQFALPWRAF
ncbi:MAG: multicomponent Na+:H+ antiporter subunit [Clostridia bacterium]|nr:multicomponent Na+:H+ antiporter subunit [Clostridia bacterium]